MAKPPEEWLAQDRYDMDTAAYMFRGGRYMYTVFMCHLAIEKALKVERFRVRLSIQPDFRVWASVSKGGKIVLP